MKQKHFRMTHWHLDSQPCGTHEAGSLPALTLPEEQNPPPSL